MCRQGFRQAATRRRQVPGLDGMVPTPARQLAIRAIPVLEHNGDALQGPAGSDPPQDPKSGWSHHSPASPIRPSGNTASAPTSRGAMPFQANGNLPACHRNTSQSPIFKRKDLVGSGFIPSVKPNPTEVPVSFLFPAETGF